MGAVLVMSSPVHAQQFVSCVMEHALKSLAVSLC